MLKTNVIKYIIIKSQYFLTNILLLLMLKN